MQGIKQLQDYSKEIEPRINQHRQQMMQNLKVLDQECNNKYIGNENKFVECLQKLTKRVEKHSKRLEFGLLFWKHRTYECFEAQGKGENDFGLCRVKQNKMLEDILKQYQI